MIPARCRQCGKDYETRYGAKWNPFECPGCVKKNRDLVKRINCKQYRGVRIVREPQIGSKS